MKILLIDDDETLLTIFDATLKKEGMETVTALDGAGGIGKAKAEKPDLILLDQVLPDTSGNQVLKQLKALDATKNIPVIILSNFSQEELVKEAINSGAEDYVFKYQIEPQDLVGKIKSVLGSKNTVTS